MPGHRKSFMQILRSETLTLLLLLFAGTLLLPIAIYMVGGKIFGAYSGSGFGDFYRDIHGDLRDGQPVVIFLVLSPYLIWQLLRTSFYVFRRMSPSRAQRSVGTDASGE
jgi:hypothetical protein